MTTQKALSLASIYCPTMPECLVVALSCLAAHEAEEVVAWAQCTVSDVVAANVQLVTSFFEKETA